MTQEEWCSSQVDPEELAGRSHFGLPGKSQNLSFSIMIRTIPLPRKLSTVWPEKGFRAKLTDLVARRVLADPQRL